MVDTIINNSGNPLVLRFNNEFVPLGNNQTITSDDYNNVRKLIITGVKDQEDIIFIKALAFIKQHGMTDGFICSFNSNVNKNRARAIMGLIQ